MDLRKEFELTPKNIFTIPNILSYIRIVLIIPFMVMFLQKRYVYAAVCLVISGLTDCIDGFLARSLNQVTKLGKVLDPIADKLTLLSVGICISFAKPMVIPVTALLILKDITMVAGASYLINKGIMPCASEWYGKVGTVCFYLSVSAIVVFDLIVQVKGFEIVSFILLSLTTVIMLYSLFRYSKIFKELIKNAEEGSESSLKDSDC